MHHFPVAKISTFLCANLAHLRCKLETLCQNGKLNVLYYFYKYLHLVPK